jgi:hypothetical protein
MHHDGIEVADAEGFSRLEQMIELRAVGGEIVAQIEHLCEHRLHRADGRTDRDTPIQPLTQPARGAEMVGMGMGLEYPLHPERQALDGVDHPLRRCMRRAAGPGIEVEHRIHDRAAAAGAGMNDMGEGAGHRVEQRLDLRCGCGNGIHPWLLFGSGLRTARRAVTDPRRSSFSGGP